MNKTRLFLIVSLIFSISAVHAQKNTSKCELKIVKVSTQNFFGRNMGYVVKFKNDETKVIDGIAWIANFYDRFGDFKGKKEGKWASGSLTKPSKPGSEFSVSHGAWIKDADDVFITVTKIHYADGTQCK